ncbi:outer membrane efflux protein [Caballeronia novacaledonica]|uniref:Outer membrane efflux protein n=1 Tax=Caballeronia novacaledonica TaxID=1544861 RepID=A0A2U3I132_9BURK|nr:TolC family protein [Caballeronia novacaledonica]SPB13792.1 outer membrane efflux protein [Caballeronia novacaledonica]
MQRHPSPLLGAAVACALSVLAGCASLQPQPATTDQIRDRVVTDQLAMYDAQEPVKGPITFYQAAARALKYNLDYRLKLMESALASNLRDVSTNALLPQLVASAGYTDRSNDSGGTSIGIEDRQVSLRPSTSEQRYHKLASLGLTWNLIDFGMAYYRTQQRADQMLMAEERRRKVAQNVLQDVRNAYWRALSAQRLKPEVDQLIARTQAALRNAHEAQDKGLMPRQDVLAYQRALLDAISLLTVRRQDLEFAQAELVALMSLPPGTPLVLADTQEGALPMPPLATPQPTLELIALQNRPEIMEESYRKRVNENDIKIAKAQLWPNIGIDMNVNYDSNAYLYNNYWAAIGVRVSLNLFRLLQLPALNEQAVTQEKTDETRRLALSMAILTQVRIGSLRYQLARQELDFADDSLRVDHDLLDYANAARTASLGSELEVIRAEGRFLLSRYLREAAYSDCQAAWGRLYNSLGYDVMPDAIAKDDVDTLAQEIKNTMTRQETYLPRLPAPDSAAPLPPFGQTQPAPMPQPLVAHPAGASDATSVQ